VWLITWVIELCKLAKTCNFAGYLNTALQDQVVCGLREPHIQRELLSIRDLTIDTALNKSRAMEATSAELQNFQTVEGDSATHAVSRPPHRSCYRCGNLKHVVDSCPHKDKQCNKCRKTSHLASQRMTSHAKHLSPKELIYFRQPQVMKMTYWSWTLDFIKLDEILATRSRPYH